LYNRTYANLYEKYHPLDYNKYQIDYLTNETIKLHNRETLINKNIKLPTRAIESIPTLNNPNQSG
jgi:hypothetical protein